MTIQDEKLWVIEGYLYRAMSNINIALSDTSNLNKFGIKFNLDKKNIVSDIESALEIAKTLIEPPANESEILDEILEKI